MKVCHLKNLPAKTPVPDMPRITAVKRTSLRVRSRANTPDAADRSALENIRAALEAGNAPVKILLQRVWFADGKSEWPVYRPIAVAAERTACHGRKDDMTPELRAELERLYPTDEATEFATGEWRGLIRISLADAPPPSAK